VLSQVFNVKDEVCITAGSSIIIGTLQGPICVNAWSSMIIGILRGLHTGHDHMT
jgi:hypothetical protein